MANTLSVYDPIFYAQEGLIQLEKALGMAGRVYRGYDKSPQQKGSTITIPVPATFSAQDAPGNDQSLTASSVSISLDYWREVKFALSDKELTFTTEKIINDHIRPAAYALADDVDQKLATLYKDLYLFGGTPASTPDGIDDITGARKLLQDNAAPDDGNRHFMIDTAAEEKFLQLAAFNTNAGAPAATQEVLMRGSIGTRFGIEFFANQNTPSHTTNGNLTAGTALQTNAQPGLAKNAAVLKDSGGSLAGTIKAGTVFTVNGDTQTYVITEDATAAANLCSIKFEPATKVNWSASAAVTLKAAHVANLCFHKNCFALAMAPLSEMGNQLGAKIATVTYNGLALRSRLWYDGDTSSVKVGLDVLFGLKTLDRRLGVRWAG